MIDPATASSYAFLYFPIENAEDIVDGRSADPAKLGVAAPDPRTLRITLKAPTGYFLSLLAHSKFLPVHRASVEKFGAAFTRPGNLVSNGAFTLAEWTPQSRIVLVKNPNYHDAANVRLDKVIYLPIESASEEFKRYRAGEIDVTDQIPTDQVDFVRRGFTAELKISPFFGSYYYGYNLTQPPFKDNLKLREALAMVIDREVITDKLLKTGEKPAYGWVPPGIAGYQSQTVPWQSWPMARRIAEAKTLYAEAGYGPDHPLRTEISFNTSEAHRKIAIAVAAMWHQALGVETTLSNQEFKVFLDTRREKKATQVFRAGWIGDYPDPNSFAELLRGDSGLNDFGYANPAYDALVSRAAMTVDNAQRLALLAEAEKLLIADMPMIPIYYYVQLHLVKPYVSGYEPNFIGEVYSKDVTVAAH